MAETILVVVEQREGKLNRVSYETLRGAQTIAADTGWPLEAVVLGSGAAVSDIAQEIAKIKVAKVYALDSAACASYTPDAYATALRQFISDKRPALVLMPHTYQVRDFAPKLTTSLNRTLISDATGYRKDGAKLIFVRQMFQGKFAADVSFAGEAPFFATFQTGVPFYQPWEITEALEELRAFFPQSGLYLTVVPSYIGGFMALSWAGKGKKLGTPAGIRKAAAAFKKSRIKTDYYNTDIHQAAFALPEWIKRLVP